MHTGDHMTINAIDLFAGCGGLTEGLEQAGITVKYAVELDPRISKIYEGNHHKTIMINSDIRRISDDDFRRMGHVDIVAGCPPCQGFTQMNRNNKRRAYSDKRNILIEEYLRAVKIIKPNFIMMENVPQIIYYDRFNSMLEELKEIGYSIDFKEINVKDFGIPQSRRRLVLIGALSHDVDFPFRMNTPVKTVRDAIESLPKPTDSSDPMHRIHSNHTPYIQHIIELIPKNGGNRKNLPKKYWLECHKKANIGYSDVYGRMFCDRPSPTITGGCLSPSKGRFLHPTQNRSISVREASILQSFPIDYYFDDKCPKTILAQMIGNAIPPKFAKIQGLYIKEMIENED